MLSFLVLLWVASAVWAVFLIVLSIRLFKVLGKADRYLDRLNPAAPVANQGGYVAEGGSIVRRS